MGNMLNCKLFLAIFATVVMVKMRPSQKGWFIHSLYKNENIPMRESPCLISKENAFQLLMLKQKSPELIRVQMPSFSFRLPENEFQQIFTPLRGHHSQDEY